MDVLDAIMIIVSDLFSLGLNAPAGTASILTNAIRGVIQGIMAFVEYVQQVYAVLQGLSI
jgi:hypothetical protein